MAEEEGDGHRVNIVWHGHKDENGDDYHVDLYGDETYYDFQLSIYSLTSVRPENQKLFSKHLRYEGKACTEDLLMSKLNLPENVKIKLFGQTEDELEAAQKKHEKASANADEIIDDFDWDYVPDTHTLWDKKKADRRLQKMILKTEVNLITPPRENKKLLVLDLDHTLLHWSSSMATEGGHKNIMVSPSQQEPTVFLAYYSD